MHKIGRTQSKTHIKVATPQKQYISDSNTHHLSTKLPSSPINSPTHPTSSLPSISFNKHFQQLPTKLTDLIDPQDSHLLPIQNQMIKLLTSHSLSLHFHDEAASLIQKYPTNDIVFIGIWGSTTSDKSYFYDRILNLCGIDNKKYVDVSTLPDSNVELYFYHRPFVKNNIRFFLLDCKGYTNHDQLTLIQKHQLDIILSICQIIILIQNSNSEHSQDITKIGYQHFQQSAHRLFTQKINKYEQPIEISWPTSLFVLYSTNTSIKKHQKSMQHQRQLCNMFHDYNFSILHSNNTHTRQQIKSYISITNSLEQLYLKNTIIIFKSIYTKVSEKCYMNMKYNGFTIPHILTQLVYAINKHHNLYLPKIFNKAKRSALLSIYNKHTLSYLLKIQEYLTEEKSYSTDYLLDIFQLTREQTMDQYTQIQNQIILLPSTDTLCTEFQKKLQDYIEQKQKDIINVNRKKSQKQLINIFSWASIDTTPTTPLQQLKKIKTTILENKRNYDTNIESIIIANILKQLTSKYTKIHPITNKPITYSISNCQQPTSCDNPNQLQLKKTLLIQKQLQLEQINQSIMTKQNSKYHQLQQKNIKNQIINYQLKIQSSKSNTLRNEKHNQSIIEQVHKKNDELKKILHWKIVQRNILEEENKRNIIITVQQGRRNRKETAQEDIIESGIK